MMSTPSSRGFGVRGPSEPDADESKSVRAVDPDARPSTRVTNSSGGRELIGYLADWGASPGGAVDVRFSTTEQTVSCELVRLGCGDESESGPGLWTDPVQSVAKVRLDGASHPTFPGSFAVVPGAATRLGAGHHVVLSVWVWPTLLPSGSSQTILGWLDEEAGAGVRMDLTPLGQPRVVVGSADGCVELVAEGALRPRFWYRLDAVVDTAAGNVALTVHELDRWANDLARSIEQVAVDADAEMRLGGHDDFVIAADCRPGMPATNFFNGKVDRPAVTSGSAHVVSDFSTRIDRWTFETSAGIDGVLHNYPTRAMTGHNWSGRVDDWTRAPQEYGAIHFHADDLADANWPVAHRISLPEELRSGVYAVKLTAGDLTEHLPLFVRPAAQQRRAEVTLLMSTFTYLAYGNEQYAERVDYDDQGTVEMPLRFHSLDQLLRRHPEFGLSLYDEHTDGSGVAYASMRRPLLNVRPNYRSWFADAPRNFAADLYVVAWLINQGIDFDVVTDHDVDEHGVALLQPAKVVLTGSHPEYHTWNSMNAMQQYTDGGGNLMYLGGNGYYWVVARSQDDPGLLENRRGVAGTRCWAGRPGETVQSLDGEQGGLWKLRGRGPDAVIGVHTCATGWDTSTPGYARSAESYEPRFDFVFAGIDDDVVGEFGLMMGGSAGDELDRYEPGAGAPADTVVLASSRGRHSDYYLIMVDEIMAMGKNISGQTNPDVRADMVYFETAGGGRVFSAGSVAFVGALPWDNFQNNISTLTRNVLDDFRRASNAEV